MVFSLDHNFWLTAANHLWQSTLFAAAAWMLTVLLKKNRARVRYWIWFSVSVKFLIPFSLIVSLGGLIAPEWMKTPVQISSGWNVIHTINQPFSFPDIKTAYSESDTADTQSPSDKIPAVIIAFWLCGFSALLINRYKQASQVTGIVRKAELVSDNYKIEAFRRIKYRKGILNSIRIALTKDVTEPGVSGIFTPVLILPADIQNHVNDAEMEAILLHEMAHIRCKDNLIAFIHTIVQALFWFHPLVWWTGSRLIFERELACDEYVLESGKDPQTYAEGILKICENYLRSQSVYLSGVIGSNIKKRIEGIIENRTGHKLNPVKKTILLLAGFSVLGIPLAQGIINAPPGEASRYMDELTSLNNNNLRSDTLPVSEIQATSTSSFEPSEENQQTDFKPVPNKSILRQTESPSQLLKDKTASIFTNNRESRPPEYSEKKAYAPAKLKKVADTGIKNRRELTRDNHLLKTEAINEDNYQNPGDTKDKSQSADKHISRGVLYLAKWQTEKAVFEFSRAIKLDADNALAHVARGSAYFRMGQFDNAITDYNKSIQINPNLAVAYQNRGSVYYRQGNFDKAVPDYNKAIDIDPDLAAAYQDRGTVNQIRGRLDAAISDYSSALKLNPDDAVIYNYRGSAYFTKKQYEKAFADFNRAVDLNPQYISAYINRGTYYHTTGNIVSAGSDYKKALELDPGGNYERKLSEYLDYAEGQETECRKFRAGLLSRKVCKTKAEWAAENRMLAQSTVNSRRTAGYGVPEGQEGRAHESGMALQNLRSNK